MNHPHVFPVLQRLIERILESMGLPEKPYMEFRINHHIAELVGQAMTIKIHSTHAVWVEYRHVDNYKQKEVLHWHWYKNQYGESESEDTIAVEARLNEIIPTVFLTKKGTLSLKNRIEITYNWLE